MLVKIFTETRPAQLEEAINDWLTANPEITIQNIYATALGTPSGSLQGLTSAITGQQHTLFILYSTAG